MNKSFKYLSAPVLVIVQEIMSTKVEKAMTLYTGD